MVKFVTFGLTKISNLPRPEMNVYLAGGMIQHSCSMTNWLYYTYIDQDVVSLELGLITSDATQKPKLSTRLIPQSSLGTSVFN